MAVSRVLDRVYEGIGQVFSTRAAPEDVVNWEASLLLIEDNSCENHPRMASAISIYASVHCPEMGERFRTVCHITVPVDSLEDDDEVQEIGNDLWDRLQSLRMLTGVEVDEEGSIEEP